MRGRAHELIETFAAEFHGPRRAFAMSRPILMAKVLPEQITPETDDEAVEARLAAAIATIHAMTSASSAG